MKFKKHELDHIRRVMLSCKTPAQCGSASRWIERLTNRIGLCSIAQHNLLWGWYHMAEDMGYLFLSREQGIRNDKLIEEVKSCE